MLYTCPQLSGPFAHTRFTKALQMTTCKRQCTVVVPEEQLLHDDTGSTPDQDIQELPKVIILDQQVNYLSIE